METARPDDVTQADESNHPEGPAGRATAVETASDGPGLRPLHRTDVVGVAQLWAGQFQHMTTLALAGGGGLLILTQTGLVSTGRRWWSALVLFALTAFVSMIGQTVVVDSATEGRLPGRDARISRIIALMCIGGSIYMLTRLFI